MAKSQFLAVLSPSNIRWVFPHRQTLNRTAEKIIPLILFCSLEHFTDSLYCYFDIYSLIYTDMLCRFYVFTNRCRAKNRREHEHIFTKMPRTPQPPFKHMSPLVSMNVGAEKSHGNCELIFTFFCSFNIFKNT